MGSARVHAAGPVEQFFQLSLLGLLTSGFVALAATGQLDPGTLLFTAAGLLLRFFLVMGWATVSINPVLTTAATILYIGFYPLDVLYISQDFISATVRLVCFLSVLRVLTASTDRDYFFVKLLAFSQLLGATLLSAGLSFFVFLTLFVICGVATFCCSEMRRSARLPNRRLVSGGRLHGRLSLVTATITVGIVLLTAGLFFLLPRTARAAFRTLVSERYYLPGFSSEVTLGQIGELKTRSTPVMHARIEAPYDKAGFKWRGSALSQFDGRRWYNPPGRLEKIRMLNGRPSPIASENQLRRDGPRLSYEVRIGPVETDTLFFAGIPEYLDIDELSVVFRGAGDTFRAGLASSEGRTYRAIGHYLDVGPDFDSEVASLPEQTWAEHLLLPGTIDTRIIDLARTAGQGSTPLDRARAIEKHLRTRYGYTTELLSEHVDDPMAHFLFDRRKGHCEYFASSMAVMLRAIYIPSRVVTGFQSGQYNPMTGWHIVRASDAHSWVEAWLPGRGWTTFDPTPPDSGQRQGMAAVWSQMLLYIDAAETFWRQWVVDYDFDRQIHLVNRVGDRGRQWHPSLALDHLRTSVAYAAERSAPWAGGTGAFVLFFGAVVFSGRRAWPSLMHRWRSARISRGQIEAADAALLYGRMLALLKRKGIEKPSWLTPGEFARVVPPSHVSPIIEQITDAYHELRYGGKSVAGLRMIQLLEQLESTH